MRQHGFNLIEAAIVLGVVGLIVGGIWVAAAAAYKQHKLSTEIVSILQISQGAKNLFRIADYSALSGTLSLDNLLRAAGIMPTSYINVPGAGSVSPNGFAEQWYIKGPSGACFGGTPAASCPSIYVQLNADVSQKLNGANYSRITNADCTRLVRRLLAIGNNDIQFILIGNSTQGDVYRLAPPFSNFSDFQCDPGSGTADDWKFAIYFN